MFNFFKKQSSNVFNTTFSNLTYQQKCSLLNVLYYVSVADEKNMNMDKDIIIMNNYLNFLSLKFADVQKDLSPDKIFSDLKGLNRDQKNLLVWMTFEMLSTTKNPSEQKQNVADAFLHKLGIEGYEYKICLEQAKYLIAYYK